MSSKIEVSRTLAWDLAVYLEVSPSEVARTWGKDLRALLAAPVVERQPVAWFKRLKGLECKSDGRTYDLMFCPMGGYQPLFDSSPELAELQAIITDLQTELSAIKDECVDHVNLYKAWTEQRETMKAEIERLKGGQGEAVAWRGCNSDGEVVTEWIDSVPPERIIDLHGNAASFDVIERAYSSQPAPVSIVMPERLEYLESDGDETIATKDAWNACLDKLKELNQ